MGYFSSLLTVTGTAATGLAIQGATVTGKCKVGIGTATTLADGRYTLTLTDGQLPCLLQITNPADGVKWHTVAAGTGGPITANITPLTDMAAARVLGSEPNVFFAAFDATVASQRITPNAIQVAQADVGFVLSSTIDTTSLGNFISVPFKAATQDSATTGEGQDKALDALKLKLTTAQIGTIATALAGNQTTDAVKNTVTSMTATSTAPPVARAGSTQSVVIGSTVTLDASTSAATAGKSLTYAWTLVAKPAGSGAVLAAASTVRPSFMADLSGSYVASLVVNDGTNASAADTVTISASAANAVPVANAGIAQNVATGATVTLDGTASSDANSDSLTYAWALTAKPAGSAAVLSSGAAIKPTFAADISGNYVASLTVNDGQASSSVATVSITLNVAPVANAGMAQSVYLGESVTLDGSRSTDANGDTLTYAWSAKSSPIFWLPTVISANTSRPSFTASYSGTYVFGLVVSDGRATSQTATVTVTVANAVGPTPTGTGLVVGTSGINFWTLDETTMGKRTDFTCGASLDSIDRRPDGVIVGVGWVQRQLYEINPVSGVCNALGNTPESIGAIAVAPTGQIFGMSHSQFSRPDGNGVAMRLHKLTATGASQSYVFLSGASAYVHAMAFGPNGELYGLGITNGGQWSIIRINTETGVNTIAFTMPVAPTLGDIDIDTSGVLRTVIDGMLYKFNINTGAQISLTRVPDYPIGNSTAPIVFVP